MGGIAGHMMHIWENDNLTVYDLKQIFKKILIDHTIQTVEKIDGFNLQVGLNKDAKLIAVRNNTQLNSICGGLSVQDLIEVYRDKPFTMNLFLRSMLILNPYIKTHKIYSNWSENKRYTYNIECLRKGVTNTWKYDTDTIFIHNIFEYTKINGKWKKTNILPPPTKLSENIRTINPIHFNKQFDLYNWIVNEIEMLFGSIKTIREYKQYKLKEIVGDLYSDELYENIINRVSNIISLKSIYKNKYESIKGLLENKKEIRNKVINDLFLLFLQIEDAIIEQGKGYLNNIKDNEYLIQQLREIESSCVQIDALKYLPYSIYHVHNTEGLVFNYKEYIMKITGSSAVVNKIIGDYKYRNN